MKSRRSFALATLAVAILACLPAHAQADTLARIQQTKKIRIGLDPNLPPWSYKNDKLELAGSEYETAQLLAKDLGATIEPVFSNAPGRIPLLITDKVDLVVAAMAITPERQKVVDFAVPNAGTTVVVAAPKSMNIQSVQDLVGKRVAVGRGTSMDLELTKVAPPGVEIVRFEDEATTLTSILSGQLDIVAQSTTLNDEINKRNTAKNLETKFVLRVNMLGMAVRKGDARLLEWVNQWVKTNMANGRLQAIFQKYHNTSIPDAVVQAAK